MFNYIFENKVAIFNSLDKFGFVKQNNIYTYKTKILDDNFLLKITVNKNSYVNVTIKDIRYKKVFTNLNQIIEPYLKNCVKVECEYYLNLICELCFTLNNSKSPVDENNNSVNDNCIKLYKDYQYLCRLITKNKSCYKIIFK